MSLAQMEYFEASARTLSFTRAAAELCVSQQAVSKGVAALEEELGVSLFERRAGGLALTAAGQRAVPRVRDVIRAARLFADETRAYGGRQGRRILRLGVPNAVMGERYTVSLTDVLAFEDACPAVRLDVVEGTSDGCRDLLASHDIDVAIVAGRADWRRFWTRRLYREWFRPFVGRCHPLASRDEVTVADLSGEVFLVPRGAQASIDELCEAFYEAGCTVPLPAQFVCPDCSPQLLMERVYRGEGVAFMGQGNVNCIDKTRGTVLRLNADAFVSRLSVATLETKIADEDVAALIDYLVALFGSKVQPV